MDLAGRISERLTQLADEHPLIAWCAFSLLYVFTWSVRAARKPFWYDELFTIYIARLPGLSQIWEAFTSAADGMPPLLHLLTKASMAAFGEGALSVRIPAMLGVWTMCLCLYLVVRRHCPAINAWVAAELPLVK